MLATDYASDPRAQAIAAAARRLVEFRDRWLNPPEWVEWVEEPVPGDPLRPVRRDAKTAKALKKRSQTTSTAPGRSGRWMFTRSLTPQWPPRTVGPSTSRTT